MARLDNSGMHRPDRYLMQCLSFDRQERVRRVLLRGFPIPERMSNIPKTEIKPWPRIRRTFGFEPKQIADGALQTNSRTGGAPRRLDRALPLRDS